MPHHTKSMLPNIRGYPRSSIKWNQFATSDGMLLMFTRHFQHWWHWWQCLSLSASDISDGKSQEWVRQIWLTHYIFFMRLVAENSLNYMHISEINFMSTWFIYTQFCNWHMFKWSYLMRTTLSAAWVVWAEEVCLTLQCWGITTMPLYWIAGYLFLSFQTILFDLQHSWTPKWPVTFVSSADSNDFPYGS